MVPKKLVSILLDPDADEDPIYCTYDINGKFHKVRDFGEDSNNISMEDSIKRFFHLDLPYITYHDVNPFELMDEECETLDTRIFKYSDAVMERDTVIGNEIGIKTRRERVEKMVDHRYLPGKPDLIYESYPFFKPNLEGSIEMSNEEFQDKFVSKFQNLLKKKLRLKEKANNAKNSHNKSKSFETYMSDIASFQTPVEYPNYFTIYENEFFDVFSYRIFGPILDIYSNYLLSEKSLKKYIIDADESYSPTLNSAGHVSLKPIGSVAHSPFAFGISDVDTQFLNTLFVHVELVNLSLGIGEGYELYFNSEKRNFINDGDYDGDVNETGCKIVGPESTKINNFLKYFTKCVSICLNSKTNRFIMTDYYWCGLFQIDDVLDGEIEDVKKLISKVNVLHYSYSNFEKEEDLSIRLIIASFFNISSSQYLETNNRIHKISKKVIKDWELFKKSSSFMNNNNNNNNNNNSSVSNRLKRFKLSPFVYSTSTGVDFCKQRVDLEKSLIKFIAIGYEWSCQTLCVDLKKLFQDKLHYTHLNYSGTNQVLLSVYDQQYDNSKFNFTDYYRDGKKIITSKQTNVDTIFGLPLKDRAIDESYVRWISSVEVYDKLKPLQGDHIAKVIDYGYLEDKPYNGEELHFKTDGYYIIYEPISSDFQEMAAINIGNSKHYEMAKATLSKIHEFGVAFNPKTKISLDIMRFYKDKVYLINLEQANTAATKSHISKDLLDLDVLFKKCPAPTSTRRSSSVGGRRRRSSTTHHQRPDSNELNRAFFDTPMLRLFHDHIHAVEEDDSSDDAL